MRAGITSRNKFEKYFRKVDFNRAILLIAPSPFSSMPQPQKYQTWLPDLRRNQDRWSVLPDTIRGWEKRVETVPWDWLPATIHRLPLCTGAFDPENPSDTVLFAPQYRCRVCWKES